MKFIREYNSESLKDTSDIAKKLCESLKVGDAILFRGEMGAGKTTFTKTVAEYFNCDDSATSPTFALVNEYFGDVKIFHFDLYRLSNIDDLYSIGFYDYIAENAIFIVEWSENIDDLESEIDRAIIVEIEKTGDDSRKIIIKSMEELRCLF